MLIALIARDKPDSLQIRLDNREEHVGYLERSQIVSQAGPLLGEAGDMVGSLIIFDVEEMEQVTDWIAGDPYTKAELFASTELIEWKKVI
ncbi:MAG: YciI family protein [Pseudomonadota bacterium]